MKPAIIFGLLLAFCFAGCTSYEVHAARRSEELRRIYPIGITRSDVQNKWGASRPDFTALRPAGGWESEPDRFISKQLLLVESRTKKDVIRVDRYWGADGFMSLCYCWYYFDSEEKLVDVEWQYKSD